VGPVVAEGLWKRFGRTAALVGLDLAVPPASILGLPGRNGADKTTAVRILATLLLPTEAGMGWRPRRRARGGRRSRADRARRAASDARRAADREGDLVLLGRLQRLPRRAARERAQKPLERLALAHAGDLLVRTYSGGMRRRLDLVASLVIPRPIVFLDEPTTGLDPKGRLPAWNAIRNLAADGAAVLLTTRYLEEADCLADRIVVLSRGRSVAEGPSELKDRVGNHRASRSRSSPAGERALRALVANGLGASYDERSQGISLPASDGAGDLERVLAPAQAGRGWRRGGPPRAADARRRLSRPGRRAADGAASDRRVDSAVGARDRGPAAFREPHPAVSRRLAADPPDRGERLVVRRPHRRLPALAMLRLRRMTMG
jgi:ABC-2 type transport system ATP-binding protein